MTKNKKIDQYLTENYADILFKTKVKGFRWQPIADEIGKNINKEVVRIRWKEVKKKQEVLNQKTVAENKNKTLEVVTGNSCKSFREEEIEHLTISYTPTPVEKFNLLKWFKSLFNKL
jgi:Fe-S cluster biosynthesis and repair protein YggX